MSLWGSNPRLHRTIPVRRRGRPRTWVEDQRLIELTTCQLDWHSWSQLDQLPRVCWLQYPGSAGVQVGLTDTCVQLCRFDTRPDGWYPTGSVDVAASASAVWDSLSCRSTRFAITGGSGWACPTDASVDLVDVCNACGYARVPIVPGGPGLYWPSSVAPSCGWLAPSPLPRLPCSGRPLGSGYPTTPSGTPPIALTLACPASG